MKFTIAALTIASAAALSDSAAKFLLDERFEVYKSAHGKVYSEEEHDERRAIFESNVEEITKKNEALKAQGLDEVHGINRVSNDSVGKGTLMASILGIYSQAFH